MSYSQKLEAASNRIKQHNDILGADKIGTIDCDKFAVALKAFGASSEESLGKLSWEDILDCLLPAMNLQPSWNPNEQSNVKPKLLARDLAVIFRGKEDPKEEFKQNPSAKKVRNMTLQQLIEAYDPNENDEVSKRLAEISKEQPFLVFVENTKHIEASLKCLEELKAGYPPRQFYIIDGIPQEVFPLGYTPNLYADENPLYIGRPLRPDGTCDQTNRSWAGVSQEVKQFLRIGMSETGHYDPRFQIIISRIEDAHYYMDLVMNSTEPMNVLRQRYSATSVQFDKLTKEGKLPTLKISLTIPKENKGIKTNPFNGGKQVHWMAPVSPTSNHYRVGWCSS
jgi:hypothetical protein